MNMNSSNVKTEKKRTMSNYQHHQSIMVYVNKEKNIKDAEKTFYVQLI